MFNEENTSLPGKKIVINKPKKDSKMKKFWVIFSMLIILLIPIAMINGIISDRESFRKEASDSVAIGWGKEQKLHSPDLYYTYKVTNKDKTEEIQKKYMAIKDYNVDVNITTEIRKKGIFKVPVYTADVQMKGTYKNENANNKDLTLEFKVSDFSGFVDRPLIKINNKELVSQSNNYTFNLQNAGETIPFEISYKVRGENQLFVEADGDQTKININGNWENPSFTGNFLPVKREVSKQSFSAEWSIPLIALYERASVDDAGVSLLIPVDSYRMTERALKYAFLFLALTFLSYFIFEIGSKDSKKIHPLQYCMLGGSMIIFYMLLLSMSEFLPFLTAYIIAASMIIGLISLYNYFVIVKKQNKGFVICIFSLMAILYIFLYILLMLQDLSLLIGSLGLFIIIACVMYATRNIEWYSEGNQ